MSLNWQIDIDYQDKHFSKQYKFSWTATSTGIFGPSGIGKSTLLEILLGLRKKAHVRGRVTIDGKIIFASQENIYLTNRERPFAWLPQDVSLFPHLNVEQNILYGAPEGAKARGKEIVEKTIRTLALEKLLQRSVQQISGGEKHRVALARAIISERKILLLDEPLSSLDAELREKAARYVELVREDFGLGLLYVSHDRQEMQRLCDKIIDI